MLEQQPREHMPALWGLADVGLVLLRKSDVFKMVIPSKIFEAMGAGRPIVLGVEGEAREIVERAGCGHPSRAGASRAAGSGGAILGGTPGARLRDGGQGAGVRRERV
jgi:hypothetical protein